jgi:hypothetical protein
VLDANANSALFPIRLLFLSGVLIPPSLTLALGNCFFQSSGVWPRLIASFSSRVLHCLGIATSHAGQIALRPVETGDQTRPYRSSPVTNTSGTVGLATLAAVTTAAQAERAVQAALKKKNRLGLRRIASMLGVGVGTVQRISRDLA